MEKRLPLALFLSFLILYFWGAMNRPAEPELPVDSTLPVVEGKDALDPALGVTPADVALEPLEDALVADAEWSDWLELGRAGEAGHYWARFSNRGARLEELRLDGYWDDPDLDEAARRERDHWVRLLAPYELENGELTGSLLLRSSRSSEAMVRQPLDEALWTHEVIAEGGVTRGVRFRHAPGTGLVFTKTITANPSSYELSLELALENDNPEFVGPTQFVFVPANCMPPEADDSFYIEPKAVAGWSDGKTVRLRSEDKNERDAERTGDLTATGQLAFVGVHNKYFALLMDSADESTDASLLGASWRRVFDGQFVADNPDAAAAGQRQIVADVDLQLVVPPPGRTTRYLFDLYAGPKDREILKAANPLFAEISRKDLGFFTGIASILLGILQLFERLTGNWGIAIILLTITVRAILFPLTRRSQTTMARHQTKMKRVQPKLDEIKKKYENNSQKLRQEQARIMQEEGAFPPLGGCLPMLLQIPVFFGLFQMLRSSFELRQAPFLGWIHDLSKPDHLMRIDLDTHLPFIGTIEWLNVLPPLMVVLWILQQRVMPTPADEQAARMQKMMMWMPILFGFFLYNYAAGLSLYMITQSTLGILEQSVIKKVWPLDTSEQPKKKSGFMARLAELQEQAQRAQETKGKSKGAQSKGKTPQAKSGKDRRAGRR